MTGSELAKGILEQSTEPIYAIVIELHSQFHHIVSFLRHIPLIQREHPRCKVILHGEMIRVHDLIAEVLMEPGSRCDLHFDHFEQPVSLVGSEDMGKLLVELPKYPALPKPFFTHLHLRQGETGETFHFKDLRKLYRRYGVGNIQEMDISGKLREKLVILDIPISAIEFLRFAKNRGEYFCGIGLDGCSK